MRSLFNCIFLFIFLISILFAQNKVKIDTSGVYNELQLAKSLLYTNTLESSELSYKWDTRLFQLDHYDLYAEFAIIHGQNGLIITSPEASVEVFSRTIELLKDKKVNKKFLAELYARNGIVLNLNGESEEGLKNLLKANSIFEELNDSTKIFWCMSHIGMCFLLQNNVEKAEYNIQKAIVYLENHNQDFELLDAYKNYGIFTNYENGVFLTNSNTPKIEEYLEKMQLLAKNKKYIMYEGIVYKLKGDLELFRNNNENANNYYLKSILLLKNFNYYKIETQLNYAQSLYKQKKLYQSLNILIPLSEYAAQNGWIVILHQAYSKMALIYYTLGDYKNGVSYAGKAFTFWKHISNSKRKFELDALMAENNAQKQKSISNQKIKELEYSKFINKILLIFSLIFIILFVFIIYLYFQLNFKNKNLKKLNEENIFLLGEANHRIKNNLQLIISLIAHENYKNTSSDIDSLKNLYSKIESIASLHQQIYLNEDKKLINLNRYLNEIHENLYAFLYERNITVKLNIENLECKVNSAVYIGLLMNELLINAMKHAFKNINTEKKIEIYLYSNKTNLYFEYKDNGIGIGQKKPELIELLSKQLNGEFNINDFNGMKFNLKFKI